MKWEKVDNNHYSISDCGKVRNDLTGKIIKPHKNWNGYLRIGIGRSHYFIHRLVLSAFVEKCPDGHEANHKNGIKTDNRVENLEWTTRQENYNHAMKNKLYRKARGENINSAKLSGENVRRILDYNNNGISTRILAYVFGVSMQSIRNILKRKTWKHIEI